MDYTSLKDFINYVNPSPDSKEENIDSFKLSDQERIKRELENERYNSDTRDRKWLAEWSATIVSVWLFLVFIILVSNHRSLHLSDNVINVLLGTTTLNVLGLMYIVLRGHFTSNK